VIDFAFNPYLNLSRAEKDDFYAYVCENLVSYKGFFNPFDENRPHYKNAEKVRKTVAELLRAIDVSECATTSAAAQKIKTAVSTLPVLECEGEVNDERARKGLFDAMDALEAALSDVGFSDKKDNEKFLTDSIKDLFKTAEFSVVQPRSGVVRVGGINDFRGQKFGKIYLLDFNEGVLPKYEDDCALLSDRDIAELEKNGEFEFESKISALNLRFKDELWQLLQNPCSLFCAYVSAGGNKPAFEFKKIRDAAGVEERYEGFYNERLEKETNPEAFASLVGTPDNAIEKLYALSSSVVNSLYASVKDTVDGYKYDKNYDLAPTELKTTSVSALQTFYDCPLRFYLEKRLRISQFDDGTVKPFDTGTILHAVIEKFLRGGGDLTKVDEYFDEACETVPKAALEENKAFLDRARNEAVKVCVAAKKQLASSAYKPKAFEQSFGRDEEGNLAGITLGKDKHTRLIGNIDRVDVWGNYARVIDYKTGSESSFSFADLYYGQKLQLALYSAVLQNEGYDIGGMFILPLSCSWDSTKTDNRLGGLYIDTEENVRALDVNFEIGQKKDSDVVAKMPHSGDRKTCRVKDDEQMRKITDYAVRMADRAVDLIESGYAHPIPLKDNDSTDECKYCVFKGVCERTEDGLTRKREYGATGTGQYIKGE
jgi:ATP-dependent helicase/DNAse subunit B